MFSLHLPKLTAADAEHAPLENHKQAGCQGCRALWTEARQGVVSVRGHAAVCDPPGQRCRLAPGTAHPPLPSQPGPGAAAAPRRERALCGTARLPSEGCIDL